MTWSPEYLEGNELGKASCSEPGTSRWGGGEISLCGWVNVSTFDFCKPVDGTAKF